MALVCVIRGRSQAIFCKEWLVSHNLSELVLRIHECLILCPTEQFPLGLRSTLNQLTLTNLATVLEIRYPSATQKKKKKKQVGKVLLVAKNRNKKLSLPLITVRFICWGLWMLGNYLLLSFFHWVHFHLERHLKASQKTHGFGSHTSIPPLP